MFIWLATVCFITNNNEVPNSLFQDIFKLILSMFAELADTTSPFFSRRVKILEIVSRCKCCVILLDIDCNDLVMEMFNIFFSVVRLSSSPSLTLSLFLYL